MPQAAKVYRVGVLTAGGGSSEELRHSLRDLGYVEGRNVVLEVRDTEGKAERSNDLAGELARLNVDVIVATNPASVFSAKRATATVPIVMVHTPDPVELGLVASLARPGGNITGLTTLSVNLSIKQLELLKEAVPSASRIVVLWNPDNPWHPRVVKSLREDTRLPGVQLQVIAIRGPNDFDGAFAAMIKERARAVLVLADPMTFVHRRRLADVALRHRLPLMGGPRAYTESGGLMSYWADEAELYKRAASYIDRILKGAPPATLPIEQPTRYQLVVNATTAKALALTLPPALLLQATLVE
jgi:putative ABC transport system substrate-binding protein